MAEWVKVDASEVQELARDLDNASKQMYSELGKAMKQAALIVEREAKLSMKPGTGREYKRGLKIHRASLPGRPPAPDTGAYKSSITHEVRILGKAEIQGIVGSRLIYGPWLEFGTRWMKARPHLMPALQKKIKDVVKLLENHLDKVCAYIERGG